jgi:hypothetical protein
MWQTDSAVPEIAPAPAAAPSNPEPMPTVMPAISPIIAPVGGAQVPGRNAGMVSLSGLMKYKGKSGGHGLRNGIMVVLGIGLVAGAVKLMVSSGTPKPVTAAGADPAAASAPAPATQPATKPAAKPKTVLTADAKGSNAKPIPTPTPAATTPKPRPATADAKGGRKFGGKTATGPKGSPAVASPVGGEHVDKAAGYSVKFPAGWTQRSLAGRGSWLAEASDGKSSSMAIGFSSDGGHGVADAANLEALSKSYQARPDTIIQASGFGTLAGHKSMWHKLSVPAPGATSADGATAARVNTVVYFVPLGDGRALKVRVISRPETFAEAARTMKQSLDTLRLLTPEPASKQVAATE